MSGRRGLQAAGLLLLPLLGFAAFAEERALRAARAERAIAIRAARPVGLAAADGAALPAAEAGAAGRMLIQLLGDRAAAAGVRLATASGVVVPAGHVVATDLVASGGEAAVLRFANGLETARPVIRLDRWALTPTGDGLRLAGRAEALWWGKGAPRAGDTIHIPAPPLAAAPPAGVFAEAAAVKAGNGFPAELIGIVGRIAVDPQAMLRLSNGGVRTAAIGETIAGWTIDAIEADRVRFRKGGQDRVLVLPTEAD